MTTPQALKNNKEYKFPGKQLHWDVGSHTLDLEVELDWEKYENSEFTLPPKELGRCKDWHFELSDDETTATFIASWTIRRVKENLNKIDSLNDLIAPLALCD